VFDNLSYGQPDTFFWDLGDGTITSDIVPVGHGFLAINNDTTIYNTQLVVENGCRMDTMNLLITALPNTVTSFFNTDPPWGCAPLDVDFTNISAGATNYLWDFGDGTPLQSSEDASHVYTTGGNFTISLVSNDVCSIDTSYANVNVFPAPTVNFNLDQNVICLGTTLGINNLSSGAAAYSWSMGNGENAVGFEPPYLYPQQGNFQKVRYKRIMKKNCLFL
jgi:PKD repeat protein